ncbi:MAG TPA: hypothetical protein VFI42_18465 [Thermomicrobiaceae bacterium]|nr:hypothetical protein [Thermomicrobiaceae bacterium]
MAGEREINELVAELRRGLAATPANWSAEDFQRFCENIARAIARAGEQAGSPGQQPEYGEVERPG